MFKYAAITMFILVALGAWRSSIAWGAKPAKHPDLDHPQAREVADTLQRELERGVADSQLRNSVRTAMETLGTEHYASQMLRQALSQFDEDEAEKPNRRQEFIESVGRVVESLRFRPLLEAELPQGFPRFTPLHFVEVKSYPPYRAAKARMQQPSGSQNSAFSALFRHIKRNEIAMTAPVELDYSSSGESLQETSMSFLYRQPDLGSAGADRQDDSVEVVDVGSQQVVAIGMRGKITDEAVMAARDRLNEWLDENSTRFERIGPVRSMGYNSPFIPRDRQYFEVQIPIREVDEAN